MLCGSCGADLSAEVKIQIRLLRRDAYRLRRRFYENYLLSPQWQTLRRVVLARAGGICEHCRSAKATQIHHKTYDRLGNELPDDLLAVCDACHGALHSAEEVAACS